MRLSAWIIVCIFLYAPFLGADDSTLSRAEALFKTQARATNHDESIGSWRLIGRYTQPGIGVRKLGKPQEDPNGIKTKSGADDHALFFFRKTPSALLGGDIENWVNLKNVVDPLAGEADGANLEAKTELNDESDFSFESSGLHYVCRRLDKKDAPPRLICQVDDFGYLLFSKMSEFIQSVSPDQTDDLDGAELTIQGQGFSSASKILLADQECKSIQVVDDRTIRCAVPSDLEKKGIKAGAQLSVSVFTSYLYDSSLKQFIASSEDRILTLKDSVEFLGTPAPRSMHQVALWLSADRATSKSWRDLSGNNNDAEACDGSGLRPFSWRDFRAVA
jgi:hypothetical protein